MSGFRASRIYSANCGRRTPCSHPSLRRANPTGPPRVDDIGLRRVGIDAAEGLYRLVDAAYEKRALAISSYLRPASFDEFVPKAIAAAAAVRLHHTDMCQTSGESVRLTPALIGQVVESLN